MEEEEVEEGVEEEGRRPGSQHPLRSQPTPTPQHQPHAGEGTVMQAATIKLEPCDTGTTHQDVRGEGKGPSVSLHAVPLKSQPHTNPWGQAKRVKKEDPEVVSPVTHQDMETVVLWISADNPERVQRMEVTENGDCQQLSCLLVSSPRSPSSTDRKASDGHCSQLPTLSPSTLVCSTKAPGGKAARSSQPRVQPTNGHQEQCSQRGGPAVVVTTVTSVSKDAGAMKDEATQSNSTPEKIDTIASSQSDSPQPEDDADTKVGEHRPNRHYHTVISTPDQCTRKCDFCHVRVTERDKLLPLSLIKSLPKSKMAPLTMLQGLGARCPTSLQECSKDHALAYLCPKCYLLVQEGDVVYTQLTTLKARMVRQWPEKGVESDAVVDLSIILPSTTTSCLKRKAGEKEELPINSSDHKSAKRDNIKKRMQICGFCGMDLYGVEEWCLHSVATHRLDKKWRWHALHLTLKTLLAREIQKPDAATDTQGEGGQEARGVGSVRHCTACGQEFLTRAAFIDHLTLHHSISVDEEFLSNVKQESEGREAGVTYNKEGTASKETKNNENKEQHTEEGRLEQHPVLADHFREKQSNSFPGTADDIAASSRVRGHATQHIKEEETEQEEDEVDDVAATFSVAEEKLTQGIKEEKCIIKEMQHVAQMEAEAENKEAQQQCSVKNKEGNNEKIDSRTVSIQQHDQSIKKPSRPPGVGCRVAVDRGVGSCQWRCRLCAQVFSSQQHHDTHKLTIHPDAVRVKTRRVTGEHLTHNTSAAREHRSTSSGGGGGKDASVTTTMAEIMLDAAHSANKGKSRLTCRICCQVFVTSAELKKHCISAHKRSPVPVAARKGSNDAGEDSKDDGLNYRSASPGSEGNNAQGNVARKNSRYSRLGEEDGTEFIDDDGFDTEKEDDEGNTNTKSGSKKETSEKNYQCCQCTSSFPSQLKLVRHGWVVHGKEFEEDEATGLVMVECQLCEKRLYSTTSFRYHMAKTHNNQAYQQPFRNSCKMCIYQAWSRNQLYKHMQEKHGVMAFHYVKCEYCGKMYNNRYIKNHITSIHEKQKKFSCTKCPMKFNLSGSLKTHMIREHSSTKWKCKTCHLEFAKYHQMRQHHIYVHSTTVHLCEECGRSFKRKSDLTEHKKRRHEERQFFHCSHCSKTYTDRLKLRNHLMKKHNISWEDTLSNRYARRLREFNCLRKPSWVTEQQEELAPPGKDKPHMDEEEDEDEEFMVNDPKQIIVRIDPKVDEDKLEDEVVVSVNVKDEDEEEVVVKVEEKEQQRRRDGHPTTPLGGLQDYNVLHLTEKQGTEDSISCIIYQRQ